MDDTLINVISNFKINGDVTLIKENTTGHINKTFVVFTNKKGYVLQRINNVAFKDVDLLMNNICVVTNYLDSICEETMTVVFTKNGMPYFKTKDNEYFRMFNFVSDSICIEEITNISLVDKEAEAFGKLHKMLSKLDASLLKETIPHFHDTPKRYKDLMFAVNEDKLGRLSTCVEEVNYAKTLENKIDLVMKGLEDETIHYAITHNDPKINNILFDRKTGEVRCVIDLDTMMPGSILFDIGDTFRSLFTGANEDSNDLSLIKVDFEVFRHYVRSYLKEMKNEITPRELELIPYSAFLLAVECGMRFLEDYLRGDIYFRTKYETHNLVRCRTQFKLGREVEQNFDKLSKIVQEEFDNISK